MLCANVKVSAEIYEKNNTKPPAGTRYSAPADGVFSFGFKRIITGKAPSAPSKREASCNHPRKGAAPSPAPCICAYLRFCRKVRSRALYCCYPRAIEENRAQSVCGRGVFLNLTELSYRSTRKKDFAERFFAKRSGKRCKRGVRLRRTTRRVRFAATMSVQKEIRELFTGRTRWR